MKGHHPAFLISSLLKTSSVTHRLKRYHVAESTSAYATKGAQYARQGASVASEYAQQGTSAASEYAQYYADGAANVAQRTADRAAGILHFIL